jgi:segregation and condensation protein B
MNAEDGQHLRLIEALLFASRAPVPARELAARLPEGADVDGLLAKLAEAYANRGVNLVKRGGTWTFRTAPDLAAHLAGERVSVRKLSRAAVETLAIVAYHQPVTRSEIEEVRGVGLSKGTLDILFEAGWVRPRGRRRTPGRPMTWATTDAFLDHFGLESLDELPGLDELKAAGLLDTGPVVAGPRASAERPPPGGDEDEDDEADAGDAVGLGPDA